MTTANERIFLAIGELTASVEALRQEVRRNAGEDKEARAKIESAADAAARAIADAINRIETVEVAIEAVKPFAAKADKWERQGIWAAGFLAALGAIFGGSLIAFKEKLLAILTGGPPPGG